MGLAWITGNSGTGKSDVCAALAGKGYRTIDSDWGWPSGEIGIRARSSMPFVTGRLSRGLVQDHDESRCGHRVKLPGASRTQTAFLCGLVENDEELWDLFDVKICSTLDDRRLRERLAKNWKSVRRRRRICD